MLGCQSDRTTPPNRVEELFKLYYNPHFALHIVLQEVTREYLFN